MPAEIANKFSAGPIQVVAGIIWSGERFLASKRPSGKIMAGQWEFPGGKVKPGEALQVALERELDEELGISVLDSRYWLEKTARYAELTVCLHFFHVLSFKGLIQAREKQEWAWLTVEQAAGKPFLKADLEILSALQEIRINIVE
jgi:8-oxo-dGTP diphosphatase